ncbi:putative ribonuclease H-like domain-containing protein [Tanacetum coccineum]
MTLELANRSVTHPMGIAEDVVVRVDGFTFLADFVVVNFEPDPRVPIILGRPFLRTAKALIDLYEEKLTLRVGNDELVFYADKYEKIKNKQFAHAISVIDFSKDEPFSGRGIQEENFQVYSNPLFEFDDNFTSSNVNPLFNEMMEDVENENSNVSNSDEPVLLNTPLSVKVECSDSEDNIDEIDAFLAMEVSSNFEEGYYDSGKGKTLIFLRIYLVIYTTHNLAPEVISDHEPKQNESIHNTSITFSPRSDPLHHEFAGEIITLPSRIAREHEEYLSLMTLLCEISTSQSPENFPASPIPVEDSDPVQEEIDIFLVPDDLIPPGVENDDSEDEDNSTFLPENESSILEPSSPRPPPEPPDVKIHLEPNTAVTNNFDVLNKDACFNLEEVSAGRTNVVLAGSTILVLIDAWVSGWLSKPDLEVIKKMRKSMLKQEFLEFRVSKSEGLHKGYDRTLEIDVKGGSSYDSRGTSALIPSGLFYCGFGNVIENVLHSFVAESDPQQQITYEDFDQIGKLDLEELDIKWQMAMLSVRINRFEKEKDGRKKDDGLITRMLQVGNSWILKQDVENGAAQVYGMIVGAEDDAAGSATGDATGDVADDVSNAAAEFALMETVGVANKPMGIMLQNIPSFVPKAASVPAGSRNRPTSVPAGRPFSAGTVTFGGGDGKITGKGTIRTSKLNFENVYYVEELQNFNLFSVSQICDTKNKVLFTDKECLVLSKEFQLPENSQVVLRVPRRNNLCFNFSDIQPEEMSPSMGYPPYSHKCDNVLLHKGSNTRLLARPSTAVSTISAPSPKYFTWNLFSLLPSEAFYPQVKLNRDYSNARTPQQNGVAERKNRTLIEAARTMLADSKLPTMFWTEAVSTACYVLKGFSGLNPLQTNLMNCVWESGPLDGKFEGKADEGFIVGYAAHSKAYRVYNLSSKKIEETLNLRYLEDKPNVQGLGHEWYFDLDYLTDSLGYTRFKTNQPAGTQDTNIHAGTQDDSDSECDEQVIVVPSFPSNSFSGPKVHEASKMVESSSDYVEELARLQNQAYEANATAEKHLSQADLAASRNRVPAGKIDSAVGVSDGYPSPSDLANSMSSSSEMEDIHHHPDTGIFSSSSYDDDFGGTILGDLTSPVQTRGTLKKSKFVLQVLFVAQALNDPAWVEAMQEEMQQFINQKVWQLVPLPDGKIAIGTKWILKNKRDARGIVVRNKARLVAQGHRQEEGIDYDESAFLLGKLKRSLCYSHKGFEDPHFPKDVLRKGTIDHKLFSLREVIQGFITSSGSTVDGISFGSTKQAWFVWMILRSMIGSLMYLTASRPDIQFAVSACSRHQVTPLTSNLNAVKKIFKYLKGQPKLGLWYLKDSPFVLEASLVIVTMLCKKQTIVATSSTKAEYVAAANCCGQVLKIHTVGKWDDLLTKPFDGPSTKSGSWDQFGSSLAIALICLTEGRSSGDAAHLNPNCPETITDPDHSHDHESTTTRQPLLIHNEKWGFFSYLILLGPSAPPEVSYSVQKCGIPQESEFKAHKLLFKEVVGKLVKKVKLLEDKLNGRKRKFVMTDSNKEEDAEPDVDTLIKLAKAAATDDLLLQLVSEPR